MKRAAEILRGVSVTEPDRIKRRDMENVPPEVVLDYHLNQVRATTEDGKPFPRYVECSAGCGWLIGCGDAIDTISHESCDAKLRAVAVPGVPTEPSQADRVIIVQIPSEALPEKMINERISDENAAGWTIRQMMDHNGFLVLLLGRAVCGP
jgi:hypothetical protein